MRVGIPLGGTDRGRSGIGTYVGAVLPRLAASLAERGHELSAFGTDADFDAYRASLVGIATERIPAPENPAFSALWYLTDFARYARTRGVDVLLYPAAQRRICLWQPLPTVAVVHDLGQLAVADKYDPLRMFYFKRVALPLIARTTRPVAISQTTRADMVRALHLRAEDIAVVPNGVDADRFRPFSADSPEVLEVRGVLGLDGPYILYPARLEHPAKNHVRLLEAFAQSRLVSTHVLALSGGDWGAKERLQALARELGIVDHLRFLGFVDASIVPALYAGADVVAMVGLTEGFGLPVLEALAAGRPVCVADAGALPEVTGPLGAMCDGASVPSITRALERAASDTSLRTRCAEEGPSWARRWSWDATASALATLCIEAASGVPVTENPRFSP